VSGGSWPVHVPSYFSTPRRMLSQLAPAAPRGAGRPSPPPGLDLTSCVRHIGRADERVRVTTPGAPSPAADVLLNQDFLIWGIGPPAASLGVLVAGLLARRSSPSVGRLMLLVGVIGLACRLPGSPSPSTKTRCWVTRDAIAGKRSRDGSLAPTENRRNRLATWLEQVGGAGLEPATSCL
jgi:hypothetical protein